MTRAMQNSTAIADERRGPASGRRMYRTVEFKLYPTPAQEATLESWLRRCCWLYNHALEMRQKAWERRGETLNLYDQQTWLTTFRQRVPHWWDTPVLFARDALRRADHAYQTFFRRRSEGERCGRPRFRPVARYSSLQCVQVGEWLCAAGLRVPKLGTIRGRVGKRVVIGRQKLFTIIRRASGWYGHVVVDQGECPPPIKPRSCVGVDVGLTHFATLSNGETVENPRIRCRSEARMKRLQRRITRCVKGSRNRQKAAKRYARQHERLAARRRDFAHQLSRRLVKSFDLIAFENLNVAGLAAGRLSKAVNDAAWGMFLLFLTCKAEWAGRWAVAVDCRGTSQECPQCGTVVRKELRERIHACSCGCVLDRDEAAARVILSRALRVVGADACGGDGLYREGNLAACRLDEAGRVVARNAGESPPRLNKSLSSTGAGEKWK